MTKLLQLIVFSFGALVLFGGCQESVPEFPTGVMNLMAKYNQQGRHDDAIRIAQDWLNKHPDEHEMRARFDEQIAMSFLMRAPKDPAHTDESIVQAVAYYDDFLSVYRKYDVDVVPQNAGSGLEVAGDLSSNNRCLYYRRALELFAEPYGKTVPLTPQWKEDALKRVKTKFDSAGCK